MKQSKAIDIVAKTLTIVQKFRSIEIETHPDVPPERVDNVLGTVNPWIFGKKSVLKAVLKILDVYENTGKLEKMAFYNFCYICTSLAPEIAAAANIKGVIIPVLDPDFLSEEWDAEGNEEK